MPPSTRREVRLSASLPDSMAHAGGPHPSDQSRSANLFMPNIESILENFELFKRKHISQNREIIKANAVHQLRIRELENRIQMLEAEKAEARLHTVGLEATVSHLHHAMASIYAGWHLIGKGFANSTSEPASIPSFHFDAQPLSWPPSNRVKLEPNPNTAAVVKQVATAPGGHVGRLEEEPLQGPKEDIVTVESVERPWQHSFGSSQAAQQSSVDRSAPSVTSIIDIEGAPSPMGSPQLPDELEDAIAAAAERTMSQAWSNRGGAATPVPKPLSLNMFFSAPQDTESVDIANRQPRRRSGRKSSRRQSGFIASQSEHEPQGHPADLPHSERGSSPPPTSDPQDDLYLPSEANSEAMDGILAYNGQEATFINRSSAFQHPPTPFLDITNHSVSTSYLDASSAPHTDCEPVHAQEPSSTPSTTNTPYVWPHEVPPAASSSSEARTPGGRKRKVPTHELPEPLPTPMRLFGTATASDATPMAAATVDSESDPTTGRTRRVRKSINYALPKLNTKMRKPDPSDMIPATTPHRSNRSTPSSARGMIGSTGNLSDIRKLHEEAALHQSPAERTSNLRLTGSPRASTSRAKLLAVQPLTAQDDAGGRMADLFEIRQQAKMLADQSEVSTSSRPRAFWDNVTDTSDDESRATSNADLGELAELEAAMGELSTVDEDRQADTPRAPQPSAWPSRSKIHMSASSSTDSMVSGSSAGNLAQRPSLRRKTTTLPSRSRQSSVEQALPPDSVLATRPGPESDATNVSANDAHAKAGGDATSDSPAEVDTDRKEQPRGAAKNPVPGEVKRAARPSPAVSSSATSPVEIGKGRPPPAASAGSLVAGMKPKQRPASAGALLSTRSVSASAHVDSSAERPRTFSGTTAASAGMAPSQSSAGSSGGTTRPAVSTAQQRASLHSALTSQSKGSAAASQVTPRIGAKGLPATTTPTFRESPRMASTPMLRPTPSASSLASESSGRSSPALSVTSSTSAGTQLSSSTRASMKTSAAATSSGHPARRPGTAGSVGAGSALSRDSTTPKLGSQSTMAPSARPQPARSMPSLRRGSDKAGVTSTPRITVRSTSSTAASSGVGANGTLAAGSAATIAASKVARAMSSSMPARTKEAASVPMGLGIDFSSVVDEVPAGKELLSLTGEIEQVVQLASSPLRTSSSPSSRPSAVASSSPRSTYKASHDDGPTLGGSQAKTRRTSRRISSMTA